MLLTPPPHASQLMRGTRLVAGIGHSTVLPDMDFETYSEAGFVWNEAERKWGALEGAPQGKKGLNIVGVANYVRHPSFRILSLFYDLKDGHSARHWRPGMPAPQDLFAYLAAGGLIEAHNSSFERWVWDLYCVPRLGWQPVRFEQWRCSAAKSRASSYPGALDNAGNVLELQIQKDKEGDRLLKKFSIPRNPTKNDARLFIDPAEDAEDGPKLYRYNHIDIVSESELSSRLPDLADFDLTYWQCDQRINYRGVKVDRKGIEDCTVILRQALLRYNDELLRLTGIDSAGKLEQLKGFLAAHGCVVQSLDEDSVEALLKRTDLPPLPRRVIEIRAAIGSASVKKVFNLRNRMTVYARVHDLFIFQGARTGRPTGEGPQPTNMPKAGPDLMLCGEYVDSQFVAGSGCGHYFKPGHLSCPWCRRIVPPTRKASEWHPDCVEDGLYIIGSRSLDFVEYMFGDALGVIAGCIRGLFIAEEGHDLISSDYSQIEAVVLAVMAGEQWRIEVFQKGESIYEVSASRMYSVPHEEFKAHKKRTGQHHPLRQKGKIGELAFGYQGWIGAAKQFDMPGTDDEIKRDILLWRKASPAVEWIWGGQRRGQANQILANAGRAPLSYNYRGEPDRWDETPFLFGVEGAAIQAISTPGVEFPVIRLDGSNTGVTFFRYADILYIRLPSGRLLQYHRPELVPSMRGRSPSTSISYEGWNTNEKNGPKGWIRMESWGGRFVENIVQAISNDILRYASVNLEAASYPLVLHVYDEIVSEVPQGFGSQDEFEAIMGTMPPWAQGWPIRAVGGWRGRRYRKG